MAKSVIVIGAGIGGLSAAIRLRAAGYEVTIYEKNPRPGGKMYEITQDGFRWDTGPSVITMRHVFEDLFASAGKKLEDYLTLLPVDPLTRYFFADGVCFDAVSNLSQMAHHIEQLEPRDVEGYLRYLAYAAQIHRITGNVFIYDKPPTPASFARVPIQDWLKADPFRTMSQAIQSHIKSPYLRQLLGRFATYVGGSPYLAPATLNVIAHVELTGGVWYPQGGIYQIALALETLATEMGIRIGYDCSIQQIVVNSNKQVKNVILPNNEVISADIVISNLDVITTHNKLLSPQAIPANYLQHLNRFELSCSGFVLLLGISIDYAKLKHHNIFFSADYPAEFDAIFKQHLPPDDPTIYIAITSKTNPKHAPQGCENWFVLVNVPPISSHYDWEQQKHHYRNLILDKLASYDIDVRPHIRSEVILTPLDLERMSGAQRGALYGASANNRFSVFLRPHNRSKYIRGLYFAGGTTHPGGGVPMVMLSGKVATDMIKTDYPI